MFFKNDFHSSSEKVDSPQISFSNDIIEKYSKISLNTIFNPVISKYMTIDNAKQLSLVFKINYPLLLNKWNKLLKKNVLNYISFEINHLHENNFFYKFFQKYKLNAFDFIDTFHENFSYNNLNPHTSKINNKPIIKIKKTNFGLIKNSIEKEKNYQIKKHISNNLQEQVNQNHHLLKQNNNISSEHKYSKYNKIVFYKQKIKKIFTTIKTLNNADLLEKNAYSSHNLNHIPQDDFLKKTHTNIKINDLYIIGSFHENVSKKILKSPTSKINNKPITKIKKTNFGLIKNYSSKNFQEHLNPNSSLLEPNNNISFENLDLDFNSPKILNSSFNLSENNFMEFKKNKIVTEEFNEKYDKLNNSFIELKHSYDELINETHNFEHSNPDIENLANEVYSIIEKKLKIEKERRATFVRLW